MSTARFVHWQDHGMWLGYFEEFPDYITQGVSLDELKDNLRDLYTDLTSGENSRHPQNGRTNDRMKRSDLIRRLEKAGCTLVRHGAKHDWYTNPKSGQSQPVHGMRK